MRYILLALLALTGLAACNNDGDLLATAGPADIALQGSGDVVIDRDTPDALALRLSWNDNSVLVLNDPHAKAPRNATLNTVQFSSSPGFTSTIDQLADAGSTSLDISMDALNSIVGRLGFEGGVAAPLYIRMRSVLAGNIAAKLSNVLAVNVTPYKIDMSRGFILNSSHEDTGNVLASPGSDGVYSGFMGVSSWYNWYLLEGSGVEWGNDGISGRPFEISSDGSKWNLWFPGQEGCYYTVVNTNTRRWSALWIPSLTVTGGISGEMAYMRKENKWMLTFNAQKTGTATIRITGTGRQYDAATSTGDDAAVATPVGFGQGAGGLTFGTSAGDITVDITKTGEVALVLDLSDPFNWTCTVGDAGGSAEEVPELLWVSGIDDGISGSWTFDNYLSLYNEAERRYAGVCNVHSLWGYKFYTEAGNWDSNYALAEGDALAGTLAAGSGTNVPAPPAGLYLMDVSVSALTYALTAIHSVQIAGVADDWTMRPLQAAGTPGVYTISLDIAAVSPWGFKVYFNESWDHYLSAKAGGTLVYGGSSESGVYDETFIGSACTLTFNLCKGTYTIEKK